MTILWMLLIGLLVGAIARLLMPGRDPMGFLVTMLLGVSGSLLAWLLGRMGGLYGPDERAGFLASIIGAVLVLALYRLAKRHRR